MLTVCIGETEHRSLAIDDGEFATAAPNPPPNEEETEDSYPELQENTTLQPPPGFKPYFTLIEDRLTGEHHHPAVHYIFADDDDQADIITNAALETLDNHTDQAATANDRFILVDISADGQAIVSTSSMSADWQSVSGTVTQAPSWGNNDSASATQLMLRISGQGPSLPGQRAREFERKKGDVAGLTQILDDLQGDLESVVGSTQ